MKFKLKAIEQSESDIQRSIEEALRWQIALGRVHSFARVNGGAVESEHKGRKRWVWFYRLFYGAKSANKGLPDISGILSDGRAFMIEVKRPGRKPTPEQQDYIDHHYGVCPVGVATSVEEALEIIGVASWAKESR